MLENDVSLLWVSKESYSNGNQIMNLHTHASYFHYIYILDGNANIRIGDTLYPAIPDHIARVPMGEKHALQLEDSKAYLKTIEIKFSILNSALQEQIMLLPPYEVCASSALRQIPAELVDIALSKSPYYKDLMRVKLMELLYLSLNSLPGIISTGETSRVSSEKKRNAELVRSAIKYMSDHLSEKIVLDDICDQTIVSKYYFSRLFKELTGQPPINYLNQLRISRAKKMLTYTENNITQIAQQLGFENVHYFSRKFKEATGISPTEYVKKYNPQLYFFIDSDHVL